MCQYLDPITNINIEIGEIKKSGGREAMFKGYWQLILCLAVLSFAVQALFKNLRCNMTGFLFVAKNRYEVSLKWDGVKFPNFPESSFQLDQNCNDFYYLISFTINFHLVCTSDYFILICSFHVILFLKKNLSRWNWHQIKRYQ